MVYPQSCRSCYSVKDTTFIRNKLDTDIWVKSILERYPQYGQKLICYNEAKTRGQHIGRVHILSETNLFYIACIK